MRLRLVLVCSSDKPFTFNPVARWSSLSVCGLKYADLRDEGHFGNAKRLECVQLAGAVVKRGRGESGSKLHALQTLRRCEKIALDSK